MKEFILALTLSLIFASQGLAEETPEAEPAMDAAAEATEEMASEHEGAAEGGMYVVVKYLNMQAGSSEHDGAPLEGSAGSGFGFDFGYKLAENMAVEFAYSSASNDLELTEVVHDETEILTGTGAYTSTGLNFVYSHHYHNGLTAVAKAGYVSESEAFTFAETDDTSATHGGVAIILGAEYEVATHKEIVFEVENALIDGPKGLNIFVGFKMGL
ncbi:MAG: outer membrane beta-barrel protein [SAR324 cluster bacterium]|nr:outer membrane beta-barrel protein [SAR324 cluster bacterium]